MTTQDPKQSTWSSRSVATRFQHGFFYALIHLAGRRPAYALLYLVAAWYTLFRPALRRRCYYYLKRRFPRAGRVGLALHSYRLAVAFGKTLIDRAVIGILAPSQLTVEFASGEKLAALVAERRGLVLVTAHVGGWQAAMASIDFLHTPVNMLLQRAAGDVDRHWFEHAGRPRPFKIIDPTGYLGGSLEMLAVLKRGELLCVMGDRVLGSDRNVVRARFLGGEALFPTSAFRIAAATGAPLAVLFADKTGAASYALHLPLTLRVPDGLGRDPESYRPFVEAFVAALEAFAVEHPYQFFNFHDMWA